MWDGKPLMEMVLLSDGKVTQVQGYVLHRMWVTAGVQVKCSPSKILESFLLILGDSDRKLFWS